jgi:hypothetical protein
MLNFEIGPRMESKYFSKMSENADNGFYSIANSKQTLRRSDIAGGVSPFFTIERFTPFHGLRLIHLPTSSCFEFQVGDALASA